MGISGLLPFLESASRTCNLNELRGMTVAIDSYCWLHKGAFSCADKLVRGESTDAYIKYCFKYINLLRSYNIKPIMVFDGQHLPAKKETEKKRREQRKLARTRATELLHMGRADQALQYFRQCVDITHEMALALIKECRNNNIDCIVAPYEADAQLAYLNACGIADIIITEDSDLILFGCSKILFKFNLDGCGVLVEKEKLNLAMKMNADQYSFEKFRHMCIISGCDYLDSLPGIGLKKAYKAISLTHNPDIYRLLPRLPQYLNSNKIVVTPEYIENFKLADATIKHQVVFDPIKREQLPLTDPEIAGTNSDYLRNAGQIDNSDRGFQLALGNIDPIRSNIMDNWNPDTDERIKSDSIWSKFYKKKPHQEKDKSKANLKSTKRMVTAVSTQNALEREQELLEYEKNLEEELKVYHRIGPPPKRAKVEVNSTAEDKEIQLNIHNPFAKLKKLSKFPSVSMDDKTQLISRFFKSKTESSDCSSSTHGQMTSSESVEYDLVQLSNEDLYLDSLSGTAAVEGDLMELSDNLSEPNESGSTSPILCSRKSHQSTTLELFKCQSSKKIFSHSEKSLIKKLSLSDAEEKPTCSSQGSDLENLSPVSIISVEEDTVKVKPPDKAVVGKLRSVGLSRFRKQNQPSILSMFNKMSSHN